MRIQDPVYYPEFVRLAELFNHPIIKHCPIECYKEYLEVTKFPYSHCWMSRYMSEKKFHRHSKVGKLVHMMKNTLTTYRIEYTDDTIGGFMSDFFASQFNGTTIEQIRQYIKFEINSFYKKEK